MLKQAYLLQRQWRDTDTGLEFTLWLASAQGPLKLVFAQQKAVCFVPQEAQLASANYLRKSSELTTLDGEQVDTLYFERQRELEAWLELGSHRYLAYEADIKPVERFLMERFIRGGVEISGDCIHEKGVAVYRNPQIRSASLQPKLSALSLDIETGGGRGEKLYSIGLSAPGFGRVFMARGAPADGADHPSIDWCGDERTALKKALACIAEHDPDLLLGWNIVGFDLQFLVDVSKRQGLRFSLGRGGETAQVLPPGQGGTAIARVPGRVVLDGVALLKAAFYPFESFSLDNVAHELLGEGKLINDQGWDKLKEIKRQFREDPVALAAYNLQDCVLTQRIFEKAELVSFAQARTDATGLPLDRVGGSVAAFDHLYLPRLHRKGKVALSMAQVHSGENSPGGYVLDSTPGRFSNVCLFDFKSLYPSIIRSFLIDPAGLCDAGPDAVPGFQGAWFDRERPILPALITELWQGRDQAKRNGNGPLSQAIKIIMNSFYGVLGSSGCRFHDSKLASSITLRGHQIIYESKAWFEDKGEEVIYGDTDSLFVAMNPSLSLEQCQTRGKQLTAELNQYWLQRLQREFRLESHLEIEFETLFSQFWMPSIRGSELGSKKRYAGRVLHEGKQELVVKGLESVRSDWTPLARNFQRELLQRWFDNQELASFCREIYLGMMQGEFDHELVFKKRIRRPLDSYKKNVPPHIQAARKHPKRPSRQIEYLFTLNGPEPLGYLSAALDYDRYAERQLAPIADAILQHNNQNFAEIVGQQMDLF
ncbi:MAG: DNA polymerase II [Granulosicoccaceae bacterium]